MPGPNGTLIVKRALELAQRRPELPVLQVLDAAMEGQTGTHPDFECDLCEGVSDWLEPPSAFAQLLARAFIGDSNLDADSPEWQTVIEAFGDRYGLWQ